MKWRNNTKSALMNVTSLEEKLKAIDKANSFLGQDLQTAIKTIKILVNNEHHDR
jgi:hypothetical protein